MRARALKMTRSSKHSVLFELAAVLEFESLSKTIKRYDFDVKGKAATQMVKRAAKRVPKRVVLAMVWSHLKDEFGRARKDPHRNRLKGSHRSESDHKILMALKKTWSEINHESLVGKWPYILFSLHNNISQDPNCGHFPTTDFSTLLPNFAFPTPATRARIRSQMDPQMKPQMHLQHLPKTPLQGPRKCTQKSIPKCNLKCSRARGWAVGTRTAKEWMRAHMQQLRRMCQGRREQTSKEATVKPTVGKLYKFAWNVCVCVLKYLIQIHLLLMRVCFPQLK